MFEIRFFRHLFFSFIFVKDKSIGSILLIVTLEKVWIDLRFKFINTAINIVIPSNIKVKDNLFPNKENISRLAKFFFLNAKVGGKIRRKKIVQLPVIIFHLFADEGPMSEYKRRISSKRVKIKGRQERKE